MGSFVQIEQPIVGILRNLNDKQKPKITTRQKFSKWYRRVNIRTRLTIWLCCKRPELETNSRNNKRKGSFAWAKSRRQTPVVQ